MLGHFVISNKQTLYSAIELGRQLERSISIGRDWLDTFATVSKRSLMRAAWWFYLDLYALRKDQFEEEDLATLQTFT